MDRRDSNCLSDSTLTDTDALALALHDHTCTFRERDTIFTLMERRHDEVHQQQQQHSGSVPRDAAECALEISGSWWGPASPSDLAGDSIKRQLSVGKLIKSPK